VFSFPFTHQDFVIEDEPFVESHGDEADQLALNPDGLATRVSRGGPRALTIACVVLAIVAGPAWVVVRDSVLPGRAQSVCAPHGSVS
jgi:hypothetical protein